MSATPTFTLPDDAATARLGAALAEALQPGDLVLLEGDLGAGKTSLARAIIRTLVGDPLMDVPSPSFALVQPYQAEQFSILHADLYRLADAREIDELGLLDDPQSIVLVEWAERAPELADQANLIVEMAIAPGGTGRTAGIKSPDAKRLGSITAKVATHGLS